MNVIQRFAARLLPTKWFKPAESDRYLGTRIGVRITPTEINHRLQSANIGDTRLLSALKAEMRTVDGDLESHLGKIEGMLLGAPVELAMPVEDDAQAEDVAEDCREQLLDPDLRLDLAVKHALWGLMDGHAGFQMLVERRGKTFRLTNLDPVPSERFWWPTGQAQLHVQPGDDQGLWMPVEQLGETCPVLVVEGHVLSRDRIGLLRRCLAPWLTKLYGFDWWARSVELTGIPYRKAKYRGGVDLGQLETALRTMGSAGYGMFPDGVDLEFVTQAMGARNAHEDLVGYCDREKAKVLLGATQTAEIQAGSGSKASAGVHERVLEGVVDGYGRQISMFLRAQVLKPLVRMNWGDDAAERLTPVPVIRVKSNADLGELFAALKLAGEAGLKTIPVKWVHMQAGIPMPEDDEECLARPVPPTPVLPPGGAKLPVPGEDPKDATEPPETPGEKPDPEDEAEPPEPSKQAAARRKASAKARRRPPAAILDDLEAWALSRAADTGKDLVAPYAAIIEEVRRDGGDIGHLAARVRLQAQILGTDPKETADLIAMVCAHATLTGFVTERT